jgi:protein-glutamine gamma-glutamyltransferase
MTGFAQKTGRYTMAGSIERYFNTALYLMVLTGFATLASTGGLDFPAVILVGLALAFRGYQLLCGLEFKIPERWTTILTLIYIGIYLADYFFISRAFLGATIHLVLFAMVIRLFSLQRTRDHYMLAALAFGMVLASAVLTVGSGFLLAFAVFLLIAVVTFVLMEMRHSVGTEQAHALDPRAGANGVISPSRRMARALLAIAPVLAVGILVGSFFIFFLLPRISSRYLTAFTPSSDVSTGFSDRVQLGRIGEIQQSSAVVMHVEIQNDVQGAYDLKWRGIALNLFDGRVWTTSAEQVSLRASGDGSFHLTPSIRRDGGRVIHYRVLMEPIGTNVFFLADKPERLIGNFPQVSMDSSGAVFDNDLATDHPLSRYEAESQLPAVDADQLRMAPNTVPPGMNAYLDFRKSKLDPRIARLTQEITVDSPSNYDKAVAIERYLSTHFGYTLQLSNRLPDDPIADFLFIRKAGHCEYFASAMAVMLRTQGIPSRIVTGFHGGEFNDLTGQYVIRASDAHSWVEAFFPGYGWVSFDPTPAASVETRNQWSRVQLYIDAAASFWREWIINYDSSHQRALGKDAANNSRHIFDDLREWVAHEHDSILRSARRANRSFSRFPVRWLSRLVLGVAVLLVVSNLRQVVRGIRSRSLRTHPERAPREAATLWYEQMVKRTARMGWRKSPSQTPQDFVAAIQESGLQKKVARFTRAYESARFGHSTDDAQQLPGLYEELTAKASGEEEVGKETLAG